jgi:hypothetical protein
MIDQFEKVLQDEKEMRAFYESVGVSAKTTDSAIKAMRNYSHAKDDAREGQEAKSHRLGL